jgi:phage tail sheath protein FI
MPDDAGTSGTIAVQRAMIDQAARLRYRVAVLDTPDGLEPAPDASRAGVHAQPVGAWLRQLAVPSASQKFAALYYPWLLVPDGLRGELAARRVPPSGHVAGVYAQVDNAKGVQHPPANVELAFVVDVGKDVTNAQQGQLNELGVNVIRSFPGRGIRVWGARSLAAGDDAQEPWWFIHIRRTMSMIEDSVEKSMQWTVFESNDDTLRRTVTHALNLFLEQIWRTGGLKGAKPDQAFYVKCDATNNPQAQIDQGWLVCEVGVAVAAPMEFLTFLVRRLPGGTGVVEA